MRKLLFFLPLLLLSSCFHKDVMNDRADDVNRVLVYRGKEGTFIITSETVFQATSKQSNGGMTTISGTTDYRITSYDVETGAPLGRVNMGDGMDKAYTILGTTPGKLWVYSIDADLGLHCRNPKTLEVISDEKKLSASGALKDFSFARPEWSKLSDLYGWNAESGLLMLTDMQGFHYYYDPEKDKLEKTEDEIPNYDWATHPLNSSGYFSKEEYVSLRGDGRQKLLYKYEDSTGKFSYLNGELIIDNDPSREAERKKTYLDGLQAELKLWSDSIAQLKAKYPVLAETNAQRRYTEDEFEASWKLDDFQRKADDIQQAITELQKHDEKPWDDPLLSDGPGNMFIVHASDVSDTAHLLVTKAYLEKHSFSETWSVKLSDFYRDPEKADSKGAFETVFSSGNPSFRFQWFDVEGDKLIFISQLQMICLDVKTGKTLWEKPL